jgi:uncharacterized membrane protein YqaE (UPF0057 family)
MKKILQQLIVLVASAALLSSCSNISKLSLTKRHYRSGYYVDFGSSKHTAPVTSIPVQSKMPVLPNVIATPEDQAVIDVPMVHTQEVSNVTKYVALQKKKISAVKIANANSASHIALAITAAPTTYATNESSLDHHTQVDVNVSFAVIVVCAIFIPPLGVALMYGITTYFWIDLILTLLFFFPGMIFALIVVLS